MKKIMNFNFMFLALAAMSVLSSCDKSNNDEEVVEDLVLKGDLTSDKTLKSGKTYSLTGGYHVKKGVILTIEPNVTVIAKDDNIVDYILVEQGGKMNAVGTATEPIVMTSERKEPGAWGGIHICGYAPINVTGAVSKSEIGDSVYGGDKVNDNSGILKYIRLEYTGYAFSEEKEANGFTFYGVGNGTKAEYLQAYKGSDDGFEWFGGTVNCKYLVSTDCTDDSFDWTEGWSGLGQFWIAYQTVAECDCLIEADNNGKDAAASPVSSPILSNLTLIGNNSTTSKRGIRLRAGTHAKIYNSIVCGKPECLTTETVQTETSLKDGVSKLEYLCLSSGISCKEGIYSQNLFTASNNVINQNISFKNKYVGTISGGKDLSSNNFFSSTNYKGAVNESNDWTKNWVR